MHNGPQFRLMQRAMDQIDLGRLSQNADAPGRSLAEVVTEAYAQQGLEVDATLIADTCRALEAEAVQRPRWWQAIRQEGVMAFYDALAVSLLAVFGVALGKAGCLALVEPLLSSPRFSAALLVTGGAVVALQLLWGTLATARSGAGLGPEWSSWWVPVRTVAWTLAVVPMLAGGSIFTHGLLVCVRWGASLAW